jgi:hypothetical protein
VITNLLFLPRSRSVGEAESIIHFASSIGSPSIDTPTLKPIGFVEKK